MKTKDVRIFVTVGQFFHLNLGSDYFDSNRVKFLSDRGLKLSLKDNGLARLIMKGMICELRIDERLLYRGEVQEAQATDGVIVLTLLLNQEVILTQEV